MRKGTPLPSSAIWPNYDECGLNRAFTNLGNLAFAMGKYQGMTDTQASVNQILSEYTNSPWGTQSTGTQLQTRRNTIPTIAGHFYAVSAIFGETNCFAAHAKQEFAILVNGSAVVVGSNLDPCTDPSRKGYDQDPITGVYNTYVSKLQSGAIQVPVTGTLPTLGIRVRNLTATGEGNDVGFDLPQLVDVTPQLDKAFVPSTILQGQTTTLTYTVTNTSDLQAKNGWHFVDTIPAGLTPTGAIGGTCTRTASSISGRTIDVTGNIALGSASCTVTVTVTSNTPGVYNNSGCVANDGTTIPNCTNNFSTITGLYGPGTAPLTVRPVVDLTITKDDNLSAYVPGQPITYTVTVHNNGPSDAVNAIVTDPLPTALQNATWTCAVAVQGTSNLPPAGPTSCSPNGTGSISDTVRINTGGTITYTITGTVALGTSGILSNTATVKPAAQTAIPNMPGGGPIPVPGSTTLVPTSDPACPPSPGAGCSATVTTPIAPEWTISKTASVNGTPSNGQFVNPGDTITYTVTARSTRGQIDGVVLKDQLSDVLDQATFVTGSAALTIGAAAPVPVAGPVAPSTVLTTPAFTLPAGQTATLTYKVVVNSGAWSARLVNVVTGTGSVQPTRCVTSTNPVAPECTTTHWTTAKVLVEKIGESSESSWVPMAGSTWAVHSDNGGTPGAVITSPSVTPVSGQTGRFQLEGIQPGVYWLEETKAPAGFSLLAEPVQFTIAANGTVSLGGGAGGSVVTAADSDGDGIFLITVRDVPALKLPESGGPGTWLFTAAGIAVLLASAGLGIAGVRRQR
ncbi:hypothetical protein BIU82_13795 [Arthrobacter sp. SW1]|nr:hypothetical protein BIU82_13795 [Arthrobacter sp. SW1]